jgi:hypothetical protein
MTAPKVSTGVAPCPLPETITVVNTGLDLFADALRAQGVDVVDVDWRIPAGGDEELIAALTRAYGVAAARIDEANREVLRRLDESKPVLVRVAPALEVVPGMDGTTILHPGPPLEWERFCDPLRRSVHAAAMAEGWAATPGEAEDYIARGRVRLEAANHHATVVPMATALGPTAPVAVVENPQGGNFAYSALNQGMGAVAWFGVDSPRAVARLVWLREVAGRLLDRVLAASGPVDVFALASQGLAMGDDVHMRCQASTNLLIRHLLADLAGLDDGGRTELARFLSQAHLFFLNLAMAAAKATADWCASVRGSTIVTAMARNGTTFGIRLGGIEGWFLAPAPPVVDALYHSGYGPDDAAADIGDSAVLELVGLGGAAAAASPAVAAFVGGAMEHAIQRTETMDRLCAGRSSRFKIPVLDGRGTPIGVDVRRVAELGITPSINTGVLHASSGRGQIGAGVAHAPLESFTRALLALAGAVP